MNASQGNQNSTTVSSVPGASIGIAVLSLAFLIGFPGNAFVLWSASCRVRKRTVTCLLILHLAIADLAVMITAPIYLRFLSAGKWEFGEVICKVCNYICGVSMYTSVFLIALMSLDRCLAISRPFISQKIRTRRSIRLLVMAIWVTGFFLAIPVLIYRTVQMKKGKPICDRFPPTPKDVLFLNLSETITGFVLPFIAILGSYGNISQRLKETRFRRKRRTGRLICLIIIAFALFWLPYHVVNLLDVAAVLSGSEKVRIAGKMARPSLVALAFFSSSINPILYAFSGSSFIRSAGLGFMAKLFEGTASEVSSSRMGTIRDLQRHGEAKAETLNNGTLEFLTTSTTPTDGSSGLEKDVSKALKSP
ncbi:leukotriene B4 receptor 1 [Varanus komodoensis]|uniref:leukotriene B4 receptor 1 n=1 Tax=Varanus komodoensis TaxID=61221 RepID=UPI001CF7AB4F|nr:leukotriene B4 receptor 1 [Varanus komodoensis]XP_044282773.1 leukotriene B4 receptor 1 [Varanus komodoensis]